MRKTEFEKLRKNCPWYYKGTNLVGSHRCLSADIGPRLDVTTSNWGKDCSFNNCAVIYWLNILTKEILARH